MSTAAGRSAGEPTFAPRLLWCASPVLALTAQLRATRCVSSLARLHEQMLEILDDFDVRARHDAIEGSRAAQAREVLAALIDHVVMTTPWGAECGWRSLANESSAEDRTPARRLLAVARASLSDAGMRELIGIVVALGFDKRHHAGEAAQIAQLMALLEQVNAKLSADIQPFKPSRRWTQARRLPRYLILGMPGSGKSAARSSMGFEVCENAAQFLQRPRSRRSLDGLLLAVSVSDLLELEPDALAAHTRQLRAQLDELQATLRVRLPCHVIVTKCDLLPGFLDWFGTFERRDRDQVFGVTLEAGEFMGSYERRVDCLTDGLLDRLQGERDPQRRFRIAALPAQLRALGELLDRFVREIVGSADASAAGASRLLRGVYLTSATQQGTPIDRLLWASHQQLELERPVQPSSDSTGNSFFLAGLKNHLLAESHSGGRGSHAGGRSLRPLLALAIVSLLGAIVAAGWLGGYPRGTRETVRSEDPTSPVPSPPHAAMFVQTPSVAQPSATPASSRTQESLSALSLQIAARTAVPCIELVAGTYPFDRRAARDAPLQDFNQLFAPRGMFDRAYADLLGAHVDRSSVDWRWVGPVAGPTAEDLERFRLAARIRDVFFPRGRTQPVFQLTLRPLSMDPAIEQLELDIEGQTVRFSPGASSPATLRWTGSEGSARIEITPATLAAPVEYRGPWALFRLFDRARIQESGPPGHFIAVFDLNGRRATLDVQSDSGTDPFRASDLERFSCPI
jgi:type VI protein secretion system component VasK